MSGRPRVPIRVDIESAVEGARNIQALTRELRDLRAQGARPIRDPTRELREGATRTGEAFRALRNQIVGALAAGTLIRGVRQAVAAFGQLERSLRALRSVATNTGAGLREAFDLATEIQEATGGLLTFGEAARAVQNALAAGATIDQARAAILALADATAAAGSANKAFGDTIVDATTALITGNSELLESAGITKNASVLQAEYAAEVGKTVKELDEYEKRLAVITGVVREAAIFTGGLEEATASSSAEFARARTALLETRQVLGEQLLPVVSAVTRAFVALIDVGVRPAISFLQQAGVRIGQVASAFAATFRALSSGDLERFREELAAIRTAGTETVAAVRRTFARAEGPRTQFARDLLATAQPADQSRLQAYVDSLRGVVQGEEQAAESTSKTTRERSRAVSSAVSLTRALSGLKEEARDVFAEEPDAQVRAWREELDRAAAAADRFRQDFSASLSTLFLDIADGADGAGNAIRRFGVTVLQTFQRILAQRFAQQLTEQLTGSFGTPLRGTRGGGPLSGGGLGFLQSILGRFLSFSEGGAVSGPGTSTSDSIPARLSAGEYVLNARTVSRLGTGLLDAINGAGRPTIAAGVLGFQAGGEVPAVAASGAAPGVRVVNVLDPALAGDYLESSAGEQTVLNVIRRNRGAVRQIVS